MKYGSDTFVPFRCSNHLMLKQMRHWQNAFTFTLIIMCIGIGLSHNIEAALDSDHGEHCSICISAGNIPVIPLETILWGEQIVSTAFEIVRSAPAYRNAIWPNYTTRAPPLV